MVPCEIPNTGINTSDCNLKYIPNTATDVPSIPDNVLFSTVNITATRPCIIAAGSPTKRMFLITVPFNLKLLKSSFI